MSNFPSLAYTGFTTRSHFDIGTSHGNTSPEEMKTADTVATQILSTKPVIPQRLNTHNDQQVVHQPTESSQEMVNVQQISQPILTPLKNLTPLKSTVALAVEKEEKCPLSIEQKDADNKLTKNPPVDLCVKIHGESPQEIISRLYHTAKTSKQKRACLNYLLHYQHYNAEFTTQANNHLGYPIPLWAPQDKPGYIRTEHNRLFDTIEPFIKNHLGPFFERCYASVEIPNPTYKKKNAAEKNAFWLDKILNNAKISSSQAVSVLKTFYPQKSFKEVCITPADLSKSIQQILDEKNILKANATLSELNKTRNEIPFFVFILQMPGIDCVVLWGAEWKTCNTISKDTSLVCGNMLKFFDSHVFSLLNETGSIPDRLAINDFLTMQEEPLITERLLKDLDNSSSSENTPAETVYSWNQQMQAIANYTFKDDPGAELYRDAILQWDACFFQKHQFPLAYQLLCSQVSPWMSSAYGVVQWAKAYQNICEIIMFAVEYLEIDTPEESKDENSNVGSMGASKMAEFKSNLLHILNGQGHISKLHADVGLFSYAMGASFFVLDNLLKRPEFAAAADIACVSQSYFETQSMLDTLVNVKGKGFVLQKEHLLDDIEGIPDILVADIHSNNARGAELYQNAVAEWVGERLNRNSLRKMILVLDITLNYWADETIQQLLKDLAVYIKADRLEIFMVQSLAKLVQLGADNSSGGLCIHISHPQTPHHPVFPTALPKKVSFYNLLAKNFRDLNARYFQCIRANSTWMYERLKSRFEEIQHQCKAGSIGAGKKQHANTTFRAADITLNTDENTVYVAINFRPLLRVLQPDAKNAEKMVSMIRELILELARGRGLPLTGRQSFGFSLSNMSNVVDSIRFSIGVETEAVFNQYVDLIGEVVDLLSINIAKESQFDIKTFLKNIRTAFAVIEKKLTLPPLSVGAIHYEDNPNTDHTTANIGFTDGILEVEILKDGQSLGFLEPKDRCLGDAPSCHPESSSNLIRLCFYLLSLETVSLYESNQGPYEITGVFQSRYLGDDHLLDSIFDIYNLKDDQETNATGKLTIQFSPFKVILPNGIEFASDKIFVRVPSLGTHPVKFKRLDLQRRQDILTKCVTHDCQANEHGQDGIRLAFDARKPFLNYHEKILKQKSLKDVVEFLNGLDFDNLPCIHDYSWGAEKPLELIHRHLHSLGGIVAGKLNGSFIKGIQAIKSKECRGALISGMVSALIKGPFEPLSAAVGTFIGEKFLPRLSLEDDDLERWIGNFDKYISNLPDKISSHPDKIQGVYRHAALFLPRIVKEYSKPFALYRTNESRPLRHIAELVEPYHPELKAHLLDLEAKIWKNELSYIEELKVGSQINIQGMGNDVVSKIKSYLFDPKVSENINTLLRLYAKYPLTPASTAILFGALKEIPEDLRLDWASQPRFWYIPLDDEEMDLVDDLDVETFAERHRQAISEFFTAMEGKKFILDSLNKKPADDIIQAFRWAVITQDVELFSKLRDICQDILNAKQQGSEEANATLLEPFEALPYLRCHLKAADPVQNALLETIDKLFPNNAPADNSAAAALHSQRGPTPKSSPDLSDDEEKAVSAPQKKIGQQKAAQELEDKSNAVNQSGNPDYWYKGVDIHRILQAYPVQKQLQGVRSLGSMTLAELTPKVDEIIASLKEKPAVCVYNIGNLHWVAFCLILQADGTIVALYKDSKGASNSALEDLLKRNKRAVRFIPHPVCEQIGDGTSCGPMAIQNMLVIAGQLAGSKKNDFIENFAKYGSFCNLTEVAALRKTDFPAFYKNGSQKMANDEAENDLRNSQIRDQLYPKIQALAARLQKHCDLTVKALKADEHMDKTTEKNTIAVDVGVVANPLNGTYAYHFRVGASADVDIAALKVIIDREFTEGRDYDIASDVIKIHPAPSDHTHQ